MAHRFSRSQSANQAIQTVIELLNSKQYDQAQNRLKVLRRQFPKNSQLMALHGDALRFLSREAEAINAYKAARKAGFDSPLLLINLATCLILNKQAKEALPYIDTLLIQNPKQDNLLALKGDALRQLKELTQARDYYRQAIALNTQSPKLYAAMVQLDQFDKDSAVFTVMKEALKDNSLSQKDRATFLATLAKAYLDIGDDSQAFDYYQQASQLVLQNSPAFEYEIEAMLTHIRHLFNPSLFNQLSPFGDQSIPQIIITGMSRSGKSLIESLFKGVKGVHIAGESPILTDYKNELVRLYEKRNDKWLTAQTPESIKKSATEYIKKLQKNLSKEQKQSIQVTTMPWDLWSLGFIGLWLPKVPIIFCVRNFMDLGITGYFHQYENAEEYRHTYDLHQLGRQIACTEKAMEHWAQVLPNPIYLVDYEALVANPQQVMDNLLIELGLEREQDYNEIIQSNTDLANTISPITSVDIPMPITDRFVGIHKRFESQLQPLIEGYRTIIDEFPRLDPPATFPHLLPKVLIEYNKAEEEPSQTASFEWEISSQITIIDNGAQLLKQKNINELIALGSFGLVAFDPAADIELNAELQAQPSLQYVPQALLGTGEIAHLSVCLDAQYSSTLTPLAVEQLPTRLHQPMQVLAQMPINTYALDAIDGLDNVDWLLLNAQHDNIAILQHGTKTLTNTLLLQVDTWMQPLYANQSSLAEMTQWAEQNGFRLYTLLNNQYAQSVVKQNELITQPFGTELQRVTAVFVPTTQRLATLTDAQKLKLAFIFDTVYRAHDFCSELLRTISDELNENYLKARGYFDKRPLEPSYSDIFNMKSAMAKGEYEDQEQLLNSWAKRHPKDPLVHGLQALLASYQDQTGIAIYHMNQALRLAPDDLSLRLDSIDILLRVGMWWEALHDAQMLYEKCPEHSEVIALYARALAAHPVPNSEAVEMVLMRLDELINAKSINKEHKKLLQKMRKKLSNKLAK